MFPTTGRKRPRRTRAGGTAAGRMPVDRTGAKARDAAVQGTRRTGILLGGMRYVSFGTGRPLVVLPGLIADHELPGVMDRRFQRRYLGPFARSHSVWWLGRRPGPTPSATMAGIALDYADALRLAFPGPVDVMGISGGGSVALQLAVDHPDVVRRLVVVSAAYRLGPEGRRAVRRGARALQSGRIRKAAAAEFGRLGATRLTGVFFRLVGWVLGGFLYGQAVPDRLATMRAAEAFDLQDRLSEIEAPTLLVGGERDGFYSADLFRGTAARIPHGRLVLYPGKGHALVARDRRLAVDVLDFLDGPGPGGR